MKTVTQIDIDARNNADGSITISAGKTQRREATRAVARAALDKAKAAPTPRNQMAALEQRMDRLEKVLLLVRPDLADLLI